MSTHNHRIEIRHTWVEVDDVGGEVKRGASVDLGDFDTLIGFNDHAWRAVGDMLEIPRPADHESSRASCPARRAVDDQPCLLLNGHVGIGHMYPE